MGYETIDLSKKNGIAILTLNRPDKLNAVNKAMWWDFTGAIADIQKDNGIRVLVLTGAGRGFCAGADIDENLAIPISDTVPQETKKWFADNISVAGLRLARLEKPTVAAVNGVAAGMGFSLALACDIRIASDNARLNNAFVRIGLIPDNGMTYLLSRIIGIGKALEMMYTGKTVSAEEAYSLGLVNQVVPADNLMKITIDLAEKIAEAAPLALKSTKETVWQALNCTLEQQIAIETEVQNNLFKTEDFREGVAAFHEKRPPIFRGL